MSDQSSDTSPVSRRTFLQGRTAIATSIAGLGPLHALGQHTALGKGPAR